MTDTPEHIKKLQQEIWMRKTPGERLEQFLKDNEAMYLLWRQYAGKNLPPPEERIKEPNPYNCEPKCYKVEE